MIILPAMYADFGAKNDCCSDSAAFSPDHQLTIGVLILLCLAAYFYSRFRTRLASPVIEIAVNAFLVITIILNVFIGIHTGEPGLALLGNGPIILLAILALAKNQRLVIDYAQNLNAAPENGIERMAWHILNLRPVLKFPVIFLLCLPILLLLTALLLLVGQKPDSMIRAFTDTYKHGFSQWDYKCQNVECGGHFLCSVAANGHAKFVKPQRLGIRNGGTIICNRQLLVSNAFEELLQEHFPRLHRVVRLQYNKVGPLIHRHYGIFNNKFVSDFIYVAMKPLEWFFLLTLYTVDRNPENRIAKQYVSASDKAEMNRY